MNHSEICLLTSDGVLSSAYRPQLIHLLCPRRTKSGTTESSKIWECIYTMDKAYADFEALYRMQVISFITNNIELGPLIIANIYRNRWQIETFFKWIQGNLTIKAL